MSHYIAPSHPQMIIGCSYDNEYKYMVLGGEIQGFSSENSDFNNLIDICDLYLP
jgi:hypothetical protein